ncbi:MAG: site-2 protease family protein [Candidatus Omnitrophica bacterium]|nr:site-2 protease family protein [Candidatus Omnitrophota bacterium]MDD5310710.1 site-2 protease family protein [Candidatus Omnitrophota bacterium]MDD5545714.1 site-2 protease family protein [Candidatus Omnitrophota bacterium]
MDSFLANFAVTVLDLVIIIPIFLFAMIIHEIAHGWVAYKLGDPTAKFSGRLTLNPVSHIDPIGTILLPITLMIMGSPVVFGWAKPVPINFMGLRNPKKDIAWVGAAGPLANVMLAFALVAAYRLFPFLHEPLLKGLMFYAISINLILAAFNLIPIPPLDGSRILFSFLPPRMAMSYMSIEPYGFMILFVMLWMGFLNWFVNPILFALSRIIGF